MSDTETQPVIISAHMLPLAIARALHAIALTADSAHLSLHSRINVEAYPDPEHTCYVATDTHRLLIATRTRFPDQDLSGTFEILTKPSKAGTFVRISNVPDLYPDWQRVVRMIPDDAPTLGTYDLMANGDMQLIANVGVRINLSQLPVISPAHYTIRQEREGRPYVFDAAYGEWQIRQIVMPLEKPRE